MPSILIIEDEEIIRGAVRRLLERRGYTVAEAGSVEEAERTHDLQRFGLILADLRLPGAQGTEVIRRAPGVPVLIMTSYASVRSAVDAMKNPSTTTSCCFRWNASCASSNWSGRTARCNPISTKSTRWRGWWATARR